MLFVVVGEYFNEKINQLVTTDKEKAIAMAIKIIIEQKNNF